MIAERVNLGCGEFPLDGWINVDAYCDAADVREDVFDCTFFGVRECRMDHFLEHISWLRTGELLRKVRTWMVPGGSLRIEVPDMSEIMQRDGSDPLCQAYIYGSQQHEGEYHRAGFTERSLRWALEDAGWRVEDAFSFPSQHPNRVGMPCLTAEARA